MSTNNGKYNEIRYLKLLFVTAGLVFVFTAGLVFFITAGKVKSSLLLGDKSS